LHAARPIKQTLLHGAEPATGFFSQSDSAIFYSPRHLCRWLKPGCSGWLHKECADMDLSPSLEITIPSLSALDVF
ncbi:MAG: hypothetical protein AB2637_01705, partial [Candidatus Thiodiazotropha sp.]